MAAEKKLKVPRFCACGCGVSIDHMSAHAIWSPPCAKIQAYKRQSELRLNNAATTRTKRMERHVYRHPGEEREPNVVRCRLCADIPDARSPLRREYGANGVTYPVGVAMNGRWECVECHEPWAPAPPVEREEFGVRSSGGMAARYGDIYGDEFLVRTTKKGSKSNQ